MKRITTRISLFGALALSLLIVSARHGQVVNAAPDCVIEQDNYTVEAQAKDTKRFAVIGDFGSTGKSEQAVAKLVGSWQPNFIVTTGDNNYTLGLDATIDANIGQYYHSYIGTYDGSYGDGSQENRFFPSLGNHDWGIDSVAPYLKYFNLPGNERYYRVVQGPLEFFMLDSDTREPDGTSSDSIQGKWLQSALADSTAAYKVVVFHHAAYSSAEHGSSTWMQWPFAEWGATLVLNGHDHVYERIIKDGFPYIVDGTGGQSLYNFKTPIDGSQVRYNCNFGALLVDVTDKAMSLRFINIENALIDSYTVAAPVSKTAD